MKFTIDINNTRIILTADQAAVITDLLRDTEQLTSKYIGASGTTKSSYIKLVEPFNVLESMRFQAISTTEYDALVLITKLQTESAA